MYSGKFSNCPCCRNACPVGQLTCGIGKAFFAEQAAKQRGETVAKRFFQEEKTGTEENEDRENAALAGCTEERQEGTASPVCAKKYSCNRQIEN